ncbi:hypothetical protein SLA2020_267400 [Shorea laevis]
MDYPSHVHIHFLDELSCMKDFDLSSKSCYNAQESCDSKELQIMRDDHDRIPTLFGSLIESQREIFEKLRLINHDNVVMDELLGVNAKIDALISKKALLKSKMMDHEKRLGISRNPQSCDVKDVKANEAYLDKGKSVVINDRESQI